MNRRLSLRRELNRHRPGERSAEGFTLVELLIGTLIAAMVIVVAMQVLVGEQRSSEARRHEMNSQQNLRVAIDKLAADLRLAGFGIDDFLHQPCFIDAGPWQVGFNADISSGVGGEPSLNAGTLIKLSGGDTYSPGDYPGENLGTEPHYAGGAETVVLGLDANLDGVIDGDDYFDDTACPVDYALSRSVNGLRSERVAFGLRGPDAYPDGTLPPPLFTYWGRFGGAATVSLWGDNDGDGALGQAEITALTPVAVSELRNIVYVDIELGTFTAAAVASMPHEHSSAGDDFKYLEFSVANRVRPRNIGVNTKGLNACGDPPARPTGIWVQDTTNDAGESISVHFNASNDELSGEQDVTHYFIYRRQQGGSYGAAIGQVAAAGFGSYVWQNDLHTPDPANIPIDGVQYFYRVTAWDCSPQESYMSAEAGPAVSQPNGSDPPVLVQIFDTACDEGGEITVIFTQSPDEPSGNVTGYRVYRGPVGGNFLAKTLIGYVAASNDASYTYLDNVTNNLAGAPPENDVNYWYTVRAVNDTIISVDSNELGPVMANDGLSAAPLESVQDVPMDNGTALQITWAKSASEGCVPNLVQGYILQRKGPLDAQFLDLHFFPSTGDATYAVQDSGLIAGQPYAYRVMVTSAGDQQPSNERIGVPTNNVDLLPPTNLIADGVPCDASGAVRLTWNRSLQDNGSGDVERYRIWRRIEGALVYGLIGDTPATGAASYTWDDDGTGVSPPVIGLTYQYAVTAFNESLSHESGYSVPATCTSASIPDAPYLAAAQDTPNDHGGSISLVFYASDDDGDCADTVTHYLVYRSTQWDQFGEDDIVGQVAAADLSVYHYEDNGSGTGDAPQDGVSYYYMLRAVGDGEMSPPSNRRGPVMALDDAVATSVIFSEGFESETGWTHGGYRDDWVRGTPNAKAQDYGESDPGAAFLGSGVYGTDLGAGGADGAYRASASTWLLSPPIDCSSASNVQLRYQRWLNVEQPSYDVASIEVSATGPTGPWHEIWRNQTEITDTSWQDQSIDISDWADGEDSVFLRFRLEADASWHYAGWNIDELQVTGDQ